VEENAARMAELMGRLQAAGFEHMVVEGFYDRPENSVVVFGISQEDAAALGREYGQEAVLTREGFVYQDGSITPTTGDVEVFDVAPDNYYSTIRFPDGAVSRFSVGLDFDTRLQPGEVRPIPAERVGALDQQLQKLYQDSFGLVNAPAGTVPTPRAREARAQYLRDHPEIDTKPVTTYVRVDQDRAKRIADAYEQMAHAPADP